MIQIQKTGHDRTGRDRAGQDRTEQHKMRRNETRHEKTRQDRTRQDQTRQDKTGQNKTRQEISRQDNTRQDKTRQDKTRRDKERHLRQAGPCLALFVLFVSWALSCHTLHVHIFSSKAAMVTFGTFRSALPLQVPESAFSIERFTIQGSLQGKN